MTLFTLTCIIQDMITGAILLLLGIAIGYLIPRSSVPMPKIVSKVNKLVGRNQAKIIGMDIIDLGIEEN